MFAAVRGVSRHRPRRVPRPQEPDPATCRTYGLTLPMLPIGNPGPAIGDPGQGRKLMTKPG